jgi:hypothetical protein
MNYDPILAWRTLGLNSEERKNLNSDENVGATAQPNWQLQS